jgi:hypothetical protein
VAYPRQEIQIVEEREEQLFIMDLWQACAAPTFCVVMDF